MTEASVEYLLELYKLKLCLILNQQFIKSTEIKRCGYCIVMVYLL